MSTIFENGRLSVVREVTHRLICQTEVQYYRAEIMEKTYNTNGIFNLTN